MEIEGHFGSLRPREMGDKQVGQITLGRSWTGTVTEASGWAAGSEGLTVGPRPAGREVDPRVHSGPCKGPEEGVAGVLWGPLPSPASLLPPPLTRRVHGGPCREPVTVPAERLG